MNIAAGRITKPRLTTFTAMILAVIRQVTKIAAIITNRCETFIVKALSGQIMPFLNPAVAAEEIEHSANNNHPDKKYQDEGITRVLERQRDVHPINRRHYG